MCEFCGCSIGRKVTGRPAKNKPSKDSANIRLFSAAERKKGFPTAADMVAFAMPRSKADSRTAPAASTQVPDHKQGQ